MRWSSLRGKVFVAVVIVHAMALAAIFLLFSFDRLFGRKPPASAHSSALDSSLTAKKPLAAEGGAGTVSNKDGVHGKVSRPIEKKPDNPKRKSAQAVKLKETVRRTAAAKPGAGP